MLLVPWPTIYWLDGVYWSLAVEITFYALIFLLESNEFSPFDRLLSQPVAFSCFREPASSARNCWRNA